MTAASTKAGQRARSPSSRFACACVCVYASVIYVRCRFVDWSFIFEWHRPIGQTINWTFVSWARSLRASMQLTATKMKTNPTWRMICDVQHAIKFLIFALNEFDKQQNEGKLRRKRREKPKLMHWKIDQFFLLLLLWRSGSTDVTSNESKINKDIAHQTSDRWGTQKPRCPPMFLIWIRF